MPYGTTRSSTLNVHPWVSDFEAKVIRAEACFLAALKLRQRVVVRDVCRLRMKNVNNILHFDVADAALSPTHWQASTFPEPFRSKIAVIHDGIDTAVLVPNPDARLTFNKGAVIFQKGDEMITFVNRNLEPYRGYHIQSRYDLQSVCLPKQLEWVVSLA